MKSYIMASVREYGDGMPVELGLIQGQQIRPIVVAKNQNGHDCTAIDLLDIIEWVKDNMPELLAEKNEHPGT